MTGSTALAICHSDKEAGRYALFYDDKRLCLWNSPARRAGGGLPADKPAKPAGNETLAALLPNISLLDKPVKMYYHHPYVCVTGGYNWDRPCAFIDNDLFVIATDTGAGMDDEPSPPLAGGEKKESPACAPLMFYRLSSRGEDIPCEKEAPCEAFDVDKYGEVSGELHYDGERLVALSGRGALALTLEGETIRHDGEIRFTAYTSHTDFGSHYAPEPGWQYSPEHRVFYRYSPEQGGVEERRFP
jgi:hypothetical protein